MNNYSLSEMIKNVYSLLLTKIFDPGTRLIRRPVYIRGKKLIVFGHGFTTGYSCRFETFNISRKSNMKIVIGKNCKIGDYVHIAAGESVVIGDDCLFASKIYISDLSHGVYDGESCSNPSIPPDRRELSCKPIKIGKNVWLGENVSILPGVTIGDGVIVGANSVVTKDVSANTIVAGIPAKPIKMFDFGKKEWVKLR